MSSSTHGKLTNGVEIDYENRDLLSRGIFVINGPKHVCVHDGVQSVCNRISAMRMVVLVPAYHVLNGTDVYRGSMCNLIK